MRSPDHLAVASGITRAREPFPANDSCPQVIVGALKVARLSRRELAERMVRDCLASRLRTGTIAKTVFAGNGHTIAMAATNESFRRIFEDADVLHADGQALVFASRLFTRTPIPERSATTDFIHDAAVAAAGRGLSFYLLGGSAEVNARATENLARLYPALRIAGHRHGYFSPDEEGAICDHINRSGADVVWAGLSAPFEYEFASRNKHRLNVGWIVTCGGCFNFVAGEYQRAPVWMRNAGLEWLFRLACEPKRLFWRYVVTNPIAAVMLLLRTAPACSGKADGVAS